MKPNDEKTEEERLEEEIAELKTRIKNTEYDLSHMFKGNAFLEQKLQISKASLEQKQKLIAEIQSNKSKPEKIKDFEKQEIEEQSPISPSQEQEIESEIEKSIT